MNEIKEKIKKISLPTKPKTFGEEYLFPEDVEGVSSVDLGRWMFKLAAWKGYSLKIIANVEIEKSWLKSMYENKVTQKIAKGNIEGLKITKDSAIGELMLNDEDFVKTKEKMNYKETELLGLNQIVEIYSMQIEVISREISRRALDAKLMQSGIIDRG